MKRTLKKTFLTAGIIILILAVICIVPMMLTGCSKAEEPAPVDTSSPVPSESPSTEPKESEKPSEEPTSPSPEAVETVTGKQSIDLNGDGTDDFAVDLGKREYIAEESDGAVRFYDAELKKADEDAFVEYKLIKNKTAELLLPRFADDYGSYSDVEYAGGGSIGASGLSGEQIIANGTDGALSAWLVDTEIGVFSVTFAYPTDVADSVFEGAFGIINSTELFLKIKQ